MQKDSQRAQRAQRRSESLVLYNKKKKTIKQYRWIRWDNPLFRWAKAKKGVLLGALGGLGDKIAPTKYN